MKRSQIPKHSYLSNSDIRFYEPTRQLHTTQTLYEAVRGNQEQNTFRRKKVSDCHQLNYSSHLNPFCRTRNVHYDQNKKEFDRKKPVPFRSNLPTDPVTLKFEAQPNPVRFKPEFATSFQYQSEV